ATPPPKELGPPRPTPPRPGHRGQTEGPAAQTPSPVGQLKEVSTTMFHYKLDGNGASRVISGAGLAQVLRRLSPTERALLGADILDGMVIVSGLTAKSVAVLVGVSASYLSAAARATPEQRAEIQDGRPLILPRARALP